MAEWEKLMLESIYNSQVKTCEEAIDRAMSERDDIGEDEYRRRIDEWDEKLHQTFRKLRQLKEQSNLDSL